MISFTAPEDNTIVPGVNNNLNFSMTFKVPTVVGSPQPPNDIDAIYFEGHADDSTIYKKLVFNGKKTDYSGKTMTVNWVDPSVYPFDSVIYHIKVYDFYTKKVYQEGQFLFKENTNYKGWYYIYKKQLETNPDEYYFSRSNKFSNENDCKNDWNIFKSKNPNVIEYTACKEYNYLPEVPKNEEVAGVDANKDTGDNDVYNLLAPLPGLTTAPDNVGDYFNIIFKIAIGLCGVLAVIMIVIGGIGYMGSESIFGKVEAKSRISAAILGLLIALGAYALLNTIDPNLLGKDGVTIKQVSAEIDEEEETEPWEGSSSGDNTKLCPEGYEDISVPWGVGSKKTLNVCKSIKPKIVLLLNDAKKGGIILSGSGSRKTSEQQALRVKHGCPDPKTPSSKCTPPTARPGYSMHESGKAIDFRCNNQKMTKTSDCFTWLSNNASKYGLYNLKSEPWHWSTNGK